MTATTPPNPFPITITVDVDIDELDGARRIVVWGHDFGDWLDSDQARELAA